MNMFENGGHLLLEDFLNRYGKMYTLNNFKEAILEEVTERGKEIRKKFADEIAEMVGELLMKNRESLLEEVRKELHSHAPGVTVADTSFFGEGKPMEDDEFSPVDLNTVDPDKLRSDRKLLSEGENFDFGAGKGSGD